jgi:ankyrin repeat protein/Cdc6-like AAA superfamily ATPase
MSVVLARASALTAELRLAQAISEFQKDLSTEQKAAFCATRDSSARTPPNHEEVMRLTEQIDRKAARLLQGRRCFGTRLVNVLRAIQQFAALGDVIVGGSQNILACGVWSLVRLMLLTVVNFSSYLEKLSALLMSVGRSAPRYEMLHQLYPRSKALQSHILEYFIVVVRLCHHLLKATKKSTFGQLVAFPSDTDIKPYQSELEDMSALIKEEVTLLMGQEVREQSSRITTLLRSAEADAERKRLDTYFKVLNACSTYDYETTWKETRKLGTTTAFQQRVEYQNWKSGTGSATLVCTGKLGSGKSVLLANVVADLNLDVPSADCLVAYFFCRHDISDSLKASTVMRSLARQILRSFSDLARVDSIFNQSPSVTKEAVFSALHTLPSTFKAYFVLDGMDECHEKERRSLMKDLGRLQSAFNLRICVACRSDLGNFSLSTLESFVNSSIMALPEENPEIRQFIDAELYECIESGRLEVGDPQLILEIADALLAGAQGMFLWVALQIEALCGEKTDDAIRRALIELPDTLQETFSRILTRSEQRQTGQHYRTRTFEFVIAARRPLTTAELREALSVTPGDDVWKPARQLNNVFSVLASCGSLIMVDEENLTVRLIHHSVKQFLLGSDPGMTGGMITSENADKAMRATVFTYLNYGVFDTQLSTNVTPSIPTQEAPYKIIRSMGTSSVSRAVALKLLKSRTQLSVDIGRVVSDAVKHANTQDIDTFKFYSYAKSFWLQHASLISAQETTAYTMLLKIITRTLGDSSTTDIQRKAIFFWAARYGHSHAVKLCLGNGMDVDTRDVDNEATALVQIEFPLLVDHLDHVDATPATLATPATPLCWAAVSGHDAVVKILAEKGADIEFQVQELTPLSLAAGQGFDACVRTLIDYGADLDSRDADGTPLSWAARYGHMTVVRTLIEKGADLEAFGYSGVRTPLIWAVRMKQSSVVKFLFEKGARWDIPTILFDDSEHSLLSRAIRTGDLPTARVLLEHGASTMYFGLEDVYDLHHAVCRGDEEMIRLLFDYGCDPNRRGFFGRSALADAIATRRQINYDAVIKLLLEKGLDIDSKDSFGRTALLQASWLADWDHVKTLVENGADRSAIDFDGKTAFSFATGRLDDVVGVKALLDCGFDIELKDGLGRTPLADAAYNNLENVVKLLLEHGADPQSKDNDGMMPVNLAIYKVLRLLQGKTGPNDG